MLKKLAAIAAAVIMLAAGVAPAWGYAPPTVVSNQRFTGADRYEVSAAIAREWPAGVPVVFVAKGTDFPDSLSAAPAAVAGGGPLLLTQPNGLPSSVRAELVRLAPAKIVVVGGEASITPTLYNELATMTPEIVRLGGADRYEASRNIVEYAFGDAGVQRVYLATGAKFPDALSASAASSHVNGAVLLVNGAASTLDPATRSLIEALAPDDIRIAGGPNSVSPAIEAEVQSMGIPLTRLSGADRYEASRSINADAFDSASSVFFATGSNFPDALGGAVLAGREGGPLYVVPGNCVPGGMHQDITNLLPSSVTLFGGPNSLAASMQRMEQCGTPPTATAGLHCGPPRTVITVSNPNPHAVSVETGLDTNGDGLADSVIGFEAPPGNSQHSGVVPAEDSSGTLIVNFLGVAVHRQNYAFDCVPPPNPGDAKDCSDFATWAQANEWFQRYYPHYGDIANLDADNDLIPCESLRG